jgi:hypothetical protein
MMKVRNVSLMVGAAVLLFAGSVVPAAVMQGSAGSNTQTPHFVSGGTVLYSQLDFPANGAPDQLFEALYAAYSAEGADDFVVTGGPWAVGGLNTPGSTGGTSISVNVTFYADAGGAPAGSPVAGCEYLGVTDYTDAGGDLSVNLSPTCSLSNGTYWVAQETRQDFATNGQHFWSNRSVQSNGESNWRNPGNGFGTGCTDWTPQTTCGVGGGTNPDFLFELTTEDVVVTTVTPAVGPFGMLMTVLALGGGSAYVLARRRRA